MPNIIRVSNLENEESWQYQTTSEEVQQLVGDLQGRNTVFIIPAVLWPVRTNNLKNFSKDFFLPTTVNHAIKIQHAVGKVFAILAALVLDIFTFPARLLMAIPRAISNARQEETRLHRYLVAAGVRNELLASGYVIVKLEWEVASGTPSSLWTDKSGKVHYKYRPEQHWRKCNVNFIEMPVVEGAYNSKSGQSS